MKIIACVSTGAVKLFHECEECKRRFRGLKKLALHTREHDMTLEQYLVKWKYAGAVPTCERCGRASLFSDKLRDFSRSCKCHRAVLTKEPELVVETMTFRATP